MLEALSKVVEYNEEREDGLVVDEEVKLISSCCCCSCSITVSLVQFEEDFNTPFFLDKLNIFLLNDEVDISFFKTFPPFLFPCFFFNIDRTSVLLCSCTDHWKCRLYFYLHICFSADQRNMSQQTAPPDRQVSGGSAITSAQSLNNSLLGLGLVWTS